MKGEFDAIFSDLPIICSTDNEFASSVELYIKNGRDLVSLEVRMTEYGLYALELGKLVQLNCPCGGGVLSAKPRVNFGVKTCRANALFLGSLPNLIKSVKFVNLTNFAYFSRVFKFFAVCI